MEVADTVRKATPNDLPQLCTALSKAFFDDPLMAWAIPDVDRRQRLLPEFFTLFTRAFLRHDQTYTTTGEVVAAALWAPPGAVPVSGEDAEELGRRIAELAGPDAPRFLGVNKLFDDHHPHGSYWYLQFLGVAPAWQGQGIGDCPGRHSPGPRRPPGQARLPRATRLSTCRVMRPLPLPNSTRVPPHPRYGSGRCRRSRRSPWGWILDGDELAGEVAVGRPDDQAAVGGQLLGGDGGDHTGAQVVADPLAVGEQLVVQDDLVAEGEGELGSRSLLAAIGVKGLKTTSKLRVLALWVLGSAAWEAAEIATTPARAKHQGRGGTGEGQFAHGPS
jgi:ribosomal protein S18 acetylase RimI-like enzyme